MPGRGPAPKPPDRRARRNADPVAMRVIVATPTRQPELPPRRRDGEDVTWPQATLDWWQMWADHPLSDDFTTTDWAELAITALMHAAVLDGELKYAAELRLRVAKFGATPEDRARLRITFAAADDAEQQKRKPASKAAERYRGLRPVGPA